MDPGSNNFIGVKIGTSNGEYALISKYIMVELADGSPIDAIPCGFRGYTQREYDNVSEYPSPYIQYKTKYFYPGETITDPPFGGSANTTESAGDIVRRSYLGFSTQYGVDESFLTYKGKQTPASWISNPTQAAEPWNIQSKGFHMDSGATVVTIANTYQTSGQTAFECGTADFRFDPESQENPYYFIYARKYTVCFAGGFDGWDIYREHRTNTDNFQLGSSGYLAGAYPSSRYPNATGDGLFKRIVVQNNTQDFGNTDYYAYLLGQRTFSHPESTNINVFVTPGIDYINNRFSLQIKGKLSPQIIEGQTYLQGKADLEVKVALPPALWFTPAPLLEVAGNGLLKSVLLRIKQRLSSQIVKDYCQWAQNTNLDTGRLTEPLNAYPLSNL
jgi:hypothetical protein